MKHCTPGLAFEFEYLKNPYFPLFVIPAAAMAESRNPVKTIVYWILVFTSMTGNTLVQSIPILHMKFEYESKIRSG
jgi:hypothetical protein